MTAHSFTVEGDFILTLTSETSVDQQTIDFLRHDQDITDEMSPISQCGEKIIQLRIPKGYKLRLVKDSQ